MPSNLDEIKNFIINENKAPKSDTKCKTLILLDATGSMSHLIEKTKKTIGEMFRRVTDLLTSEGDDKSFEIKIAVYRNYNSPESMIYEQSTWENKPYNLLKFLNSIYVSGGWGNEAIEIAFQNANQEQNLSQIILIGDAPANTKDEVSLKRNENENIWNSSVKYQKPTYYVDEIKKLSEKNIKIHTFYVHRNAEENFKQIAQLTGGNTQNLDIESSNGSADLMNLVNIEVLREMGGETLVNTYKKIYHLS